MFVPLAQQIGLDPLQLGLVMVLNLGVGLLYAAGRDHAVQLAALLGGHEGLTDPDKTPAPEVHAVSRPGHLVLGRHRLVCGDCTERPLPLDA